jgi:transcriptional regulator with XRE-family HTH domain
VARRNNTLHIRFGARVRTLRVERGLTQEDLAELANVHRTYLGGIERGSRNPSLDNIARLARALHVSISDLVAGI